MLCVKSSLSFARGHMALKYGLQPEGQGYGAELQLWRPSTAAAPHYLAPPGRHLIPWLYPEAWEKPLWGPSSAPLGIDSLRLAPFGLSLRRGRRRRAAGRRAGPPGGAARRRGGRRPGRRAPWI